MFGPCKVCLEKDKRIADLKEQITSLNLQLIPTPLTKHYELEQDYVMEGGGEAIGYTPVSISAEDQKTKDEQAALIQLEHDQMLSGATW